MPDAPSSISPSGLPVSEAVGSPVNPRLYMQRRSSSQASNSSRRSQRTNKPLRSNKPRKRMSASASSSTTTTDLISFPSLSPDSSPEGFRGEPALNNALSQALLAAEPPDMGLPRDERNDKEREKERSERSRREALTRLTTLSVTPPGTDSRGALFDDAYAHRDVPGSLHLANDDHIERMVARTGAVRLVRQLARDLAHRDADISVLRLRADERERELKRMLREADVPTLAIEHRLYALDHANPPRNKRYSMLDSMMNQAMDDDVGVQLFDTTDFGEDYQATIRQHRTDSDNHSGASSNDSSKNITARGLGGYLWGALTASRKTSRGSSVMGEIEEQLDSGKSVCLPNAGVPRRKALDDSLFMPPDDSIPSIPDTNERPNDETASSHSRNSSQSLTSWAVRLIAGNSQGGKDKPDDSQVNRSRTGSPMGRRAASISFTGSRGKASAEIPPNASGSAIAALKRLNGNTGVQSLSRKPSRVGVPTQSSVTSSPRRDSQVKAATNTDVREAGGNPTNLVPVEMDAILPLESQPPSLSFPYYTYQSDGLLTDRFGFIYDQRRKKRQREAEINDAQEKQNKSEPAAQSNAAELSLPVVPAPEDDPNANNTWQDYLRIATGPTELLSHTPAAEHTLDSPLTTSPGKRRASSFTVHKGRSISVNSSPSAVPSTTVVSGLAEFAGASKTSNSGDSAENEPVRLLLQRLTDLHDASQQERTVKWNEFMRKVRAERRREGQAAALSDRSNLSLVMPEASLADGEVVGISGLGNKGKVGRAKWREFRGLVLGGVPVTYRPKVWAECSGASAMRVPGYYANLVNSIADVDPTIVSQIEMDIHRTLTDNVFFRKGPGVTKLKEVLLAYARRNSDVGYCQGMNLIAGSLLLAMPTAEDAFWILTSFVENVLPPHYYDHGLLASRADQMVLRQYVSELLPRLSLHLDQLGIELEALTFQWFLSVFTDCLSAEALYRVWDVVLCLHAPNVQSQPQPQPPTSPPVTTPPASTSASTNSIPSPISVSTTTMPLPTTATSIPTSANAPTSSDAAAAADANLGGGSTFFFQVAVALLKLNETQLLTTCPTAAAVYTYIYHQMTNHAISIDGLVAASEALRSVIRRTDVATRRAGAVEALRVR